MKRLFRAIALPASAAPIGGCALAWSACAQARASAHCLRSMLGSRAFGALLMAPPRRSQAVLRGESRPPLWARRLARVQVPFPLSRAVPSSLGLRITRQSTGLPPAAGYRQRWAAAAVRTWAHASHRCFVHRTVSALRLLPAGSSSLISQLVSRRGRPARSAVCHQPFAL